MQLHLFLDQTIGGISRDLQLTQKPICLNRYLKDLRGYNMKDNFRPVQALNSRTLYTTMVNYNVEKVKPKMLARER